ncbi:hypothetical protein KCU78_g853, partial [Aureobasidium melanogenum]
MARLLHRSVDSETAALILQLQRDDIEAALSQGDAHENVALQLQMQQLNLVETAHNDYTIAQSISRAVFDDRDLLTEELSAEQQAMRDRQLAQRLPQGADIPLDDSTLTDNSEDDVNHRELSITCVACTNTFPWFDILETPCSHHYCVECLSELFDLSMKDETLYPPRCCRQTIPLDDAKLVLHPKLVRDFQQKSIELDAKDRTYCYDPRCSTFIPAEHITEDVAGCPDCGKRTCVICKPKNPLAWSLRSELISNATTNAIMRDGRVTVFLTVAKSVTTSCLSTSTNAASAIFELVSVVAATDCETVDLVSIYAEASTVRCLRSL